MKLITLLPTPTHVVSADISVRQGGQVISINVWNETKTFRAISVSPDEITSSPNRSFGRSSCCFWLVEVEAKEAIIYIQGNATERKIYRIDAEIQVLKRLLQTSVNTYPQGKFLFNMDKARPFYIGFNWLYDLTKKKISEHACATPVGEMVANVKSESFQKTFPLLNKAIPTRIHKGLFFTENEVYWLDRPADTITKITDQFYGEVVPVQDVEDVPKTKVVTAEITLPHRTQDKKWVSVRNEFDILPSLIRDIDEHIAVSPVTRIVTQNKTNHKTYGQYFIPTQGIYGKEMLNSEQVKLFQNRLGDAYSIVMRGQGFELLYTSSDVNAVYLRQRGDVHYSCDEKPEPAVAEVVETPTVESSPTPEEPQVAVQEMQDDEYQNRQAQLLNTNLNVADLVVSNVINSVVETKQENTVEITPTNTPVTLSNIADLDAWFQDIVESPVLYSTNIELPVTRLAMNRMVLVDLPAPYGQLLAWADMTHDKNVSALELGNNDLVSFAAATFYCKDGRVYMTETHVRLDTATVVELPAPKPPKEALQEAVSAALKEMSLVEVLSIVTASAA